MSLFLINTEISSPFLELFSVFFLVNSRFFYLFTRILFTYYCFFFATLRYAHTFLGEVKNPSSSVLISVWLCCRSFFLFNLFYHTYRVGRMYSKENPKNFRNSGINFLSPYNKGFGIDAQFWGNELATVLVAVFCIGLLLRQLFVIAKVRKWIGKSTKHIIFFVFCQIKFLLINLYHFPFTLPSIYNISGNIAVSRDIILTKNWAMNIVIANKCEIRRTIPRTIFIF